MFDMSGTRTVDRRMRDEMQNFYPKLFGKKVTRCNVSCVIDVKCCCVLRLIQQS